MENGQPYAISRVYTNTHTLGERARERERARANENLNIHALVHHDTQQSRLGIGSRAYIMGSVCFCCSYKWRRMRFKGVTLNFWLPPFFLSISTSSSKCLDFSCTSQMWFFFYFSLFLCVLSPSLPIEKRLKRQIAIVVCFSMCVFYLGWILFFSFSSFKKILSIFFDPINPINLKHRTFHIRSKIMIAIFNSCKHVVFGCFFFLVIRSILLHSTIWMKIEIWNRNTYESNKCILSSSSNNATIKRVLLILYVNLNFCTKNIFYFFCQKKEIMYTSLKNTFTP